VAGAECNEGLGGPAKLLLICKGLSLEVSGRANVSISTFGTTTLPSSESDQRSRKRSSSKPLLGRLPIDNVPDGREVLGFLVLVLEVVLSRKTR
jgi:hypothetical protein